MDTRLPRVSLRRERDVAAMVTAWTLAPRRPHWRTDRRGRAITLSFRYCRVLEDIADAVGGATLAGCPSPCFTPAFEALHIQPIGSAAYPIVMAHEPALQRQPTQTQSSLRHLCPQGAGDSRQNRRLQYSRTRVKRPLPSLNRSSRQRLQQRFRGTCRSRRFTSQTNDLVRN